MFPSSKEVFLHNFRQFLENWFFDGNSTGADLTKKVKFCTLLNLYLGNIFWLNYLFPSSKEVFLHNCRQFLKKLNFYRKYDRRGPYKNSEILYSLKFVLRIYFLAKLFVPLIKRIVSKQFEAIFGKLIFWRKFERRGPYKNSEILYSLKFVLRKYFLAKLFVPLIKRSVSKQFEAFLVNWFFDGNLTGADLTKIVKFCTILNCY